MTTKRTKSTEPAPNKRGRRPLPEGEKLETLTIRVEAENRERLEALAAAHGVGRTVVARRCMLAGLDLAEKNPGRVLGKRQGR